MPLSIKGNQDSSKKSREGSYSSSELSYSAESKEGYKDSPIKTQRKQRFHRQISDKLSIKKYNDYNCLTDRQAGRKVHKKISYDHKDPLKKKTVAREFLYHEGRIELENDHFANPNVVIDSGKDYQWILTPLSERLLGEQDTCKVPKYNLTGYQLQGAKTYLYKLEI